MKKLSKKLIVTLSLLAACVACIVGTTLALLKWEGNDIEKVNITAAQLHVTNVGVSDIKTYSSVLTDKDEATILADEDLKTKYSGTISGLPNDLGINGSYLYELADNAQTTNIYEFKNAGTVQATTNNSITTLAIVNMLPGDKVEFTINATITATVDVLYSVKVDGAYGDAAEATKMLHYVDFKYETPNSNKLLVSEAQTHNISIKCTLTIDLIEDWANVTVLPVPETLSFSLFVVQAL